MSVYAATPVSWMSDFYGPPHFVSVADCFSFVIGSQKTLPVGYHVGRGSPNSATSASSIVDGECVHEDGGLNALFEALHSPASKVLITFYSFIVLRL